MPIKFQFRQNKTVQNFAGLAIHDDAIYFQELDDNENPTRSIIIPLEEGCVVNGSIKNFDMLEAAFTKLRNETGKINLPVSIGIPSHDSVIRPLTFPKMNLDDIKGTLNLNLDEYFPFSSDNAVFDTIIIKTPNESESNDKITVLTAASRINVIERLLDISHKTDIPAGAVEPMTFAMIRSVPELQTGLCVFADPDSIVTTWNGQGIYFRVSNNLRGIQDIMSTIQYVEHQYRLISISNLILSGLDFRFDTRTEINVITLTDKFFVSRGLAMRNREGVHAFDLRPREYIELERRRTSFNPVRWALWIFLAVFFLSSAGTIISACTKIWALSDDIEALRASMSTMTQRRTELTEENSRLERQRAKTERIIKFLQSDIPVLEVMNALEASAGTGIKFDNADFSRSSSAVNVAIDGSADDEQSVVSLTEGLKSSGLFSQVILPVSRKDSANKIIFRLTLMIRNETI